MREKLIFFDIDGTLVGFDGKIPRSTYEAIDRVKDRGHKVFICTGRSRGQIYDYLTAYGFDGIIAASGAYVEYEGKVICRETMGQERVRRLIEYFEKEKIAYSLQTPEKQVIGCEHIDMIRSIMNEKIRSSGRKDNPGVLANTLIASDLMENPGEYAYAEKAIYFNSQRSLKEVQKALAPYFDVTASSFEKPDETSGEVTIAGLNKASGMQAIGDLLHCTRQDMLAFGDGPNDIEMMEYAGVGIAMGNAGDRTKEAADMVTNRIDEDGIYNALRKLEII